MRRSIIQTIDAATFRQTATRYDRAGVIGAHKVRCLLLWCPSPHSRPSPCERDAGSNFDGQKSHEVKALRIAPNSPSQRLPCRQSAQVDPAGSFRSAA